MSFKHFIFLGALIFSANVYAGDYKASCETKTDGAYCTVSLFSCDQVGQELADKVCQDAGFSMGMIDPNGELADEDAFQCGMDAGGPYTYVGCSN